MYRSIGVISLLLVVLFPIAAIAQTGRAGFPQASIWLSTTAPISGQETTVYAVVYNSTESKLESTLSFTVDTKPLSTMAVSLASGASQIYSTKWTAVQGAHSFSAQLSGTTVSDVAKDAGTVSVTVAPPPPPSAVAQATNIATAVASTSLPIISQVSQKIYNTTENLREKGLAFAQENSGQSSAVTTNGAVLGTSTALSMPVLGAQKETGVMAKFYAILVMIFASRIYFYPLLLILILFILWLLMRWVNRPRF